MTVHGAPHPRVLYAGTCAPSVPSASARKCVHAMAVHAGACPCTHGQVEVARARSPALQGGRARACAAAL